MTLVQWAQRSKFYGELLPAVHSKKHLGITPHKIQDGQSNDVLKVHLCRLALVPMCLASSQAKATKRDYVKAKMHLRGTASSAPFCTPGLIRTDDHDDPTKLSYRTTSRVGAQGNSVRPTAFNKRSRQLLKGKQAS